MAFASGTRLGPYDVVELLGAGGMGEVYRASDPRLGRDVALKVLPEEAARDAQRLFFFEREARAVAALNHPNILTVFDVGTHEGVPYLVSELLEGENLRELVSRRTPSVRQILGYALQAARGLEAAHAKGIVHRDLKPENLFLTTDGRVKILDFGLAKLVGRGAAATGALTPSPSTASGRVVGTVAYMSPEQARGHTLDARSDVFSFGVVLYELLARQHPFKRDSAAGTLTAIVEATPPDLESPSRAIPPAVGGIVRRCLEKLKEDRYASGHDVVVALEAVMAAPSQAVSLLEVEERSPYPGLQPFTEKDASVFFGREREAEELWRRIRNRKLLAVIGPSGVGKTSFLRAGVLASRPQGWAAVHTTPGSSPVLALAQALTPELVGDAEAINDLLRGVTELTQTSEAEGVVSAVKRWRSRHGAALLVMDQFEELFTSNPPETQARIAALLERLASEADVHVVVSLRDDFLIRCSDHEPLAPVFSEITPLTALSRDGLRRALVEPAKKRGYRFDDEALVEEMVSLVAGVRGALPLLAFAVARLWEKRDRERKLLSREAYQKIAGVEGALAQHAEAAMDKIGPEGQGLVRELFRNLVTAHGTRAVIDREELLSAFPDRAAAEEVLWQLVDARLLTTYEVEGKESEPSHHRVEVVHESLLKAWPRLVRWQAQDEEGAVLRDQLKQAAHLWEEKGRTSDILWTGTAYREFELWRERYTGALTALEEDFARSMVGHTQRRRRRRRAIVTAVVTAALAAATVTGVLWRRARSEARRAEANALLALGRAELDRYPTAALAYARKSLEVADTTDGRRFVVDALWRSPTARVLPVDPPTWGAALSPDGRWLAAFTFSENVLLWDAAGRLVRTIGGHRPPDAPPDVAFTPGGEALLTRSPKEPRIRMLSIPEGREIRWLLANQTEGKPEKSWWGGWAPLRDGAQVIRGKVDGDRVVATGVEIWPYDGGPARVLGSWQPATRARASDSHVVLQRGRRLVLRPVTGSASTPERAIPYVVDEPPASARRWPALSLSPRSDRVAVGAGDGRLAVFPVAPGVPPEPRTFHMARPAFQFAPAFDESNSRLLWGSSADRRVSIWDLDGPPDAEPLVLLRPDAADTKAGFFEHSGRWAVVVNHSSLTFWALRQPQVRVLPGHAAEVTRLTFTADSRWLVSCANDGVRAWALVAAAGAARRLDTGGGWCYGLAVAPDGQQVLIGGPSGALVAPFSGAPGRWLYRYGTEADSTYNTQSCAFDASGRVAATAPGYSVSPARKALRVWDLAHGRVQVMPLAPAGEADDGFDWGVGALAFAPDGQVLVSGQGGIRRFDPESGAMTWIWQLPGSSAAGMAATADARTVLAVSQPSDPKDTQEAGVVLLDLARQTQRPLTSHGGVVTAVATDPSGSVVVTGDSGGAVRAGPADGKPHLLLGHEGSISALAVSPDGKWIASASGSEIRLWPMPDLTKSPLHTLPYDELMAKLRALTNLQVVEDEASPTGYNLEVGPFPGWRDAPTW